MEQAALRTGQDATVKRATDRPRVVTLVDLLSRHGGAEQLALGIATHLNPERFESILCVSRWPPPAFQSSDTSPREALALLERKGVRFLPLHRRHKVDAGAWMRLERFLRRERVDVLHAHKFGSNVWGAIVGSMARVPVILAHEHTWSFEGQPWRRFLDRELVARASDRLIAVSREDQRRMIEIERIDRADTLFIPNGVPPSPPASGRDVRAELGLEPGVRAIGVVGLLRPQKAHQVLLRAAAVLREDWPQMRVLIVGDGPERERLEGLVDELGLRGTVRFAGLRTDVPDVLGALDIAVCCSDFEGSPLSVLEYMEAGLPVVATEVGGLPDLIEPGVNGLLVAPQDPPALAAALAELLSDPDRARAMGARGRERRLAEFDIDVIVGRLEDLYTELLAERGRSVPNA
jgi:glycosyltransferase involved in cell wall biosynthesis